MEKYFVDIQVIKYLEAEVPILLKDKGKAYLIKEILAEEPNSVFPGGGIGTKYTIMISNKKTYLYHDKHNLKWHLYREHGNEREKKLQSNERIPAGNMPT